MYLLEKAPGHIKRLLQIAEENAEDRALANRVIDEGMPTIRDMYDVMHDMIGIATSDNEAMLVISGQWTMSEDPFGNPLPEPLPLPEVAVAFKVKDRALFEKGCEELLDQMDKILNMLRSLEPDLIPPDYQIPRPTTEDWNGSTKYSYPELTALMSDALPGLVPQVSISDEAVVVGYSKDQVQEMLSARPLQHKPNWLKSNTPVSTLLMSILLERYAPSESGSNSLCCPAVSRWMNLLDQVLQQSLCQRVRKYCCCGVA